MSEKYARAFEKGRLAARQSLERVQQSRAKLKGMSVAWLKHEDWPRWQQIDPNLEPDFHYWQARSEGALAELREAGVPAVAVTISPDEFLGWPGRGGKVDSGARAAFAVFKAIEADQ